MNKELKNIKYTLVDPKIEAQVDEICRKIKLSMNGIVSDQMKQKGIVYQQNFGVTIPRIKEIALGYIPNHGLAQRLWELDIRETKIMATLLEPTEKFSIEMAGNWVVKFDQIEIIEQSVMNLFSKLHYAVTLGLEWIKSENNWVQISGFILIARIVKTLSKPQINLILKRTLEMSTTEDFHLYKSVGLCLSRLCRIDLETVKLIVNQLDNFKDKPTIGQKYISMEVNQEILFLGYK